jgi:HAD superfamily hydrolase (TIGR01490 family)
MTLTRFRSYPPVLFADIDGTLVHRSLERWFLQFLFRQKLISRSVCMRRVIERIIRTPYKQWVDWKLIYLQDCREKDVLEWIDECWEETIQAALIPRGLEFVDRLRSGGIRLVLLSGTPRPLAEPLMAKMGVDEAICAEPSIENNRYTGKISGPLPWGMNKVHYVSRWLKEEGISWENTLAMADHWQDRYLLSRVSVPMAVYPGKRLARLARENRWIQIDDYDAPGLLETVTGAVLW